MAQSLHAIIASALNIDVSQVSEDSGLDVTPNWDSLRQVILITEVERAYDVEFDLDTLSQATTVGRIRDLLAGKSVQAD